MILLLLLLLIVAAVVSVNCTVDCHWLLIRRVHPSLPIDVCKI